MANGTGRAREKKAAAARYQRRLRMLAAVKLTAGCTDCGYSEHASALEFDHLPGFAKRGAVAGNLAKGTLLRLFEEIAKCEVVCSNCHRVRTWRRNHPGEEET